MTTGNPLPSTAALTTQAMNAVSSALDRAQDAGEFLGRVDVILQGPRALHNLGEKRADPAPLKVSTTRGSIDAENAVLVHRFLGPMDRANAASGSFWTYMAFVTYRPYMEERWPLHDLQRAESWRNRARDRWVLFRPTRRTLVRHGVARLWWVADVTVDTSMQHPLSVSDPYGYTREVFKSEDRIIKVFDREVGGIPAVGRAVLERAATGGDAAKDVPFRDLMRLLTLVDGYRDIAALDYRTLSNLVESLGHQLTA